MLRAPLPGSARVHGNKGRGGSVKKNRRRLEKSVSLAKSQIPLKSRKSVDCLAKIESTVARFWAAVLSDLEVASSMTLYFKHEYY